VGDFESTTSNFFEHWLIVFDPHGGVIFHMVVSCTNMKQMFVYLLLLLGTLTKMVIICGPHYVCKV